MFRFRLIGVGAYRRGGARVRLPTAQAAEACCLFCLSGFAGRVARASVFLVRGQACIIASAVYMALMANAV